MTPQERAEKMKKHLIKNDHLDFDWGAFFAAEIRAAEHDAYGKGLATQVTPKWEAALSRAKAEAYEDAAKIAKEVAERELEVSRGYKGHMVFQSQSYIDAAVEIEDRIRARAAEVK